MTKIWKREIEFILQEFPKTRSCDKLLCDKLMDLYRFWLYDINYVEFILTVVKARQTFQRQWLYLGDPEIVNRRRKRASSMKLEHTITKKQAQHTALNNI